MISFTDQFGELEDCCKVTREAYKDGQITVFISDVKLSDDRVYDYQISFMIDILETNPLAAMCSWQDTFKLDPPRERGKPAPAGVFAVREMGHKLGLGSVTT